MNVTFVRPAFSPEIYGDVYKSLPQEREVRPPLGLAYLAAALEPYGHKLAIVDGEPELLDLETTVKRIMETNPAVVGITSTTPEFPLVTRIFKALKAIDKDIVTVAGGSHVTALPEYTIEKHPEIDYVVVAEGEKGIVRVVEEMPKDRVVKARGPHDEIDPNENVRPARHLLNYDNYKFGDPKHGVVRGDAIESQRSCPYQCHFCFRGVGTELRVIDDTKRVVDELEHTYRTNGVKHAIWFDDTFTANKKRAQKICEDILSRGIDMSFYCFTASNTVDERTLEVMKQAGFNMITFGIESGNQAILSSVGKAAKLEHYVKAYTAMVKLDIETRGSVILGHPFENHKTIWDTINFVLDDLQLQRLGVNILMPFPGTKTWFQTLKQDGLRFATPGLDGVNDDWSSYKRWGHAVIETIDDKGNTLLSRDDLRFYHKLARILFHTHPRVVGHALEQVFKGNVSPYYHRPVVEALKDLELFNKEQKEKPHRFSNGMTINEVLEDVKGSPDKYDVKPMLEASQKKGITDSAPTSFKLFKRAPPVALPASGTTPAGNDPRPLQVITEVEQPTPPSSP